jgi:hypothetical protein
MSRPGRAEAAPQRRLVVVPHPNSMHTAFYEPSRAIQAMATRSRPPMSALRE